MKAMYIVLAALILMSTLLLAACGGTSTTTTQATAPVTTSSAPTTSSVPVSSATTAATQTTTSKPTSTTTATSTTTKPTIAEKDKYGGVWKTALTVGPSTPLGYVPESANDAMDLARPAMEAMFNLQRDGTMVPKLATSWDIDVKAATIVFHLRKNVKFHDGSDFNAQNVKWCWDLILAAKKAPNINSVDVIDDNTVRVNLKVYQNTDLSGFSGGYFQIYSKASFDKNGIDYTRTRPVGTGPFKFVEYQRDTKLVYTRNENYWQPGVPYLDGLEYYVIAEETVRKLSYERGDIHSIRASVTIQPEMLKKGYPFLSESGGTWLLIPDSANAESPFAKLKVRQAVSYAIDREAIAQGLGFGLMKPAYQLYPGNVIAAVPEGQYLKTEFNPAKAKQLLTEAGYPNGFKTSIHTFVRVINKDFVTAISKMLGDVGITCDADFPEAGKYEEYRAKGWTNSLMAHGFISVGTNPNSMFNMYFPESNITMPSVKRPAGFYDLINASKTSPEVDPIKVQAIFKAMADDFMTISYVEEGVYNFYVKGAHDDGGLRYALTAFYPWEAWMEASIRK
jgi:peptide/nickel transport system substrate-binding protein